MITAEARLGINDDEIAAEIIDSEAVLINLGTGVYYTLDGTGCEVWAMIERRSTLAEIGAALAARYEVEPAAVLSDLSRLAAELLAERLVRLIPEADGAERRDDSTSGPSPGVDNYSPPLLHRYTDMAEILALDPPLPVLKDDA